MLDVTVAGVVDFAQDLGTVATGSLAMAKSVRSQPLSGHCTSRLLLLSSLLLDSVSENLGTVAVIVQRSCARDCAA